ncbi:MAG TPA: hypothetical protein VI072_30630 [Polyangiaceae bacterium]
MPVTRVELEALIAEIRASVSEPRAGIFGPGSMSWTINRESILFLGAGRAALLSRSGTSAAVMIRNHPNSVRREFGLSYGSVDRFIFRASLRSIVAVYPRLPARARCVPAYVAAQCRLGLWR